MLSQSPDETQRRRQHKKLIQGLLIGGAAIGLPALANLLVSRRARRLTPISWGSGDRYVWRHGEIVFQRLGEGEPLVLLHSFGPGHSSTEWRRAAEILAGSHQVYAPDLLGWGRSEKPFRAYDSGSYIRLIGDFLGDVVGERATLVAVGMSAAYAVQIAADRAELVRALALVVPFGLGIHADKPALKDAALHRLLRLPILGTSAMNLYTSHASIATYLRREVYGRADAVDDALVEQHYRDSHQPDAHRVLAAYLGGYLNHGVRATLSRLEQPVWLAWGRRAANPPVESADLWLHELPRAELEIFERCGLLPHTESPAEFAEKLEQFLAGGSERNMEYTADRW